MLERAALHFVNHLLQGETWARTRLKAFAGQHARFEMGPLALSFAVSGDGLLHPVVAGGDDAPQVTVSLPQDAPLRFLSDRAAVFSAARISGSADFAEALGFVSRNLRWDAEADLARVVGDVPAHRLTTSGKALVNTKLEGGRRLAANLKEYLLEEQVSIAHRADVDRYCSEVDALRDDLARLEKRMAKLDPSR